MTAPVLSRAERKARRLVIANLRGCGYTGTGFDGITGASFDEQAEQAFLRAERDCRGELTNDDGRRQSIDPRSLFIGTDAHARRWASEELIEWWEDNGRPTRDEYRQDLIRSAVVELDAAGELDGVDDQDAATERAGDDSPAAVVDGAGPGPRPWGARVLDEARAFIAAFWAPPNDAALDAYTVWLAGTHATDLDQRLVFETYPHLFLGSKMPESGKSTGMHVGSLLAARGELLSHYTAPGLLGLIDAERAALFLDELDTTMGNGSGARDLRALLLDSYKRGGCFVHGNRGNTSRVKRTPVYAPIIGAGMWQNWISNPGLDAVRTRTIMVPCARRRAGQDVKPYRSRLYDRDARALNAGLAKWGRHNAERLADAWPDIPEGIADRDRELVEPLIAVGDAAGGDWPDRIRHAMMVLLRNEPTDDELDEPTTPLEMLLADLSLVFGDADRLASRTLVERLAALPNSGWRRYPSAQAAGRELADILAPVGVRPLAVWLDGGTVKGYDRAALVAAGMPLPVVVASGSDHPADLPF